MDRSLWVLVRRLPYEEPHHTQFAISAWNGMYGGSIEIYCAVDTLRAIGAALAQFPAKVPDESRGCRRMVIRPNRDVGADASLRRADRRRPAAATTC
jgi:hypothetical protein